MKQNLLIWSTDIPPILKGNGFVGGIAVQLYFWAKIFSNNGWKVTTFTQEETCEIDNIKLLHYRYIKHIDIILEWLNITKYLVRCKPDIVMSRGSGRTVFPLFFLCKLFHIKYVFFGASDTNFETQLHELGNKINRNLYAEALRKMSYIITQNQYQQDSLFKNYHAKSLQLNNIWDSRFVKLPSKGACSDVIWVANLKSLKRPEWFVDVAMKFPQYTFHMVGGSSDNIVFEKVKEKSAAIPNFHFWGSQPFDMATELISKTTILVCTSTFEGFPNTFLQAWAYNIPVVSTVDPSGYISKYKLGIIIENEEQLYDAILTLKNDNAKYAEMKSNIASYFIDVHDAQTNYEKLMKFLEISL